jgi:endonuclease/exonuclease/phosphatase family metal-dependent hydrolase
MKHIFIRMLTLRLARWLTRPAWLLTTALAVAPPLAHAQLSNDNGDLRVMTYNVDEGTDFSELTGATTQTQFLIAVGDTITQVRATEPASRMKALARQIIAAAPMLVSLQEVAHWSSGEFDQATQSCGTVSTEFDMLQDLLNALGHSYKLAYQAMEYNFPPVPGLILSSNTFLCVALQNYVAILVRKDGHPSKLEWHNAQSGQYSSSTSVTTPLGPFVLPRAWVSIDANFNGKAFRFLGTHLESVDPTVRRDQGKELRAGPADTPLPVIIAMDSNAQASPSPQDPTYTDFIAAGYDDVWLEVFPRKPGFTCCQSPMLNNKLSQLYQRIDLILTLGKVEAQNIALFGDTPDSKTPEGLWPSDHAGVAAQLVVKR